MHAQLPLHMQPKEVGCTQPKEVGCTHFRLCCVCFRLCNFVHRKCKRIWLQSAVENCLRLQCTYAVYLYLHHLAHILLTLVKPLVKVAKVLTTYDVYVYSKLYTCASLPRSELMWLLQYEIANFYVLLI